MFCNLSSCCFLAFIGLVLGSPYSSRSQEAKLPAFQSDLFGENMNNIFPGENGNEDDVQRDIFYNIFLNELLDEFDKENQELEEEGVDLEDPQRELEELEAALDLEDGRWLDDITEEDENLPPNYYNNTEFNTKIGNEDVNVKEIIDKATSNDGKSTWLSNLIESEPEKRNTMFQCSLVKPCSDGEYCFETQFNSECMICQDIGSVCVDDAQCCSSGDSFTMCVEGRCKDNVDLGSVGTICDTSDDCISGLCCAKVKNFPRSMCKPLAKLNERCSPYLSSLNDILSARPNEYACPCESGLSCRIKSSPVYDVIPRKIKQGQFCSSPTSNENEVRQRLPPKRLNDRSELSPQGSLNNQDTLDPRWQARSETENDQRYINPYTLRRYQAAKKAAEMGTLKKLLM